MLCSYENIQQYPIYKLIYYSTSAVHVSGNIFTHHQEHLSVFTVSGSVHPSCCRLPAGNSLGEHYQILQIQSSALDDGRKYHPKHVQPTWNNKLIYILDIVDYFRSCITYFPSKNVLSGILCYFHSCITMHGLINLKFMSAYVTQVFDNLCENLGFSRIVRGGAQIRK
jgi:hypothetical protein